MKKEKINTGSITLEAAILVPMFIILMLFVNGLFILFIGQQIMSHTLIQTAKSMAFDPYASQRVMGSEDEDDLAEMFVDVFSFTGEDHISTSKWYEEDEDRLPALVSDRYIAYLSDSLGNAKDLLDEIGIKDGYYGLDFSGTTLEDGELTLKLKYTQEYIFNAAGLGEFERELSIKVKLFEYKEVS